MNRPEQGGDYFMQNPPRQPKLEVVRYVGSQGFAVPRCYETLDEARSELPDDHIFVRGEHPQDYDGASDLISSFRLDGMIRSAVRSGVGYDELLRRRLQGKDKKSMLSQYFSLLDESPKSNTGDVSVSYWERIIPKAKVVAFKDPVKNGTTHLMYASDGQGHYSRSHYVLLNEPEGTMVDLINDEDIEDIIADLEVVASQYKQISDLEKFCAGHSYSAEFVLDDKGTANFVQMHRGQDNQGNPDFVVNPADYSKEWTQAGLAVGKTESTGITLPVRRSTYLVDIPGVKEGFRAGKGHRVNPIIGRAVVEHIALNTQVYLHAHECKVVLEESVVGHSARSGITRPPLALMAPSSFAKDWDGPQFNEEFVLEVVSDGKTAMLRAVEA
jgi:hypothetical protein